jgi:organic hydroperoxide reductase OsmC/OhrA
VPIRTHRYATRVEWRAHGDGTSGYTRYSRNHAIVATGKPEILGSSDPLFRGDASRYTPEELLVASLSACHMLWYLHLCAVNRITVIEYLDEAAGAMEEGADGGGRFVRVVLRPQVTIAAGDRDRASALHDQAHHHCFIANSVNFPVDIEPAELTVMESLER